MTDRVSKYIIELEIDQADSTRRTIDDVEKSLKKISDSAKGGLADGLKEARKSAEQLANQIYNLATGEKDATQELAAYNKAAGRTLKDLEKQANTLTYSLSEQGKAQRESIEALKQELSTLGQTKEELARKKEIEKELKVLQKDVVEGTDEELKNALRMNKETRVALKLAQQEAKLSKSQIKEQKDLQKASTQEVKDLSKKVEIQKKYNAELTKTQSRFAAIKSVASKVGGGLKTVGKIGGGIVGGAMMLTTAARDAANFQVDRAREVNRIRASLTPEQKENLLSELYIDTGADAATIVDAINRVVSVLGPRAKQHEISRAVEAEIRYPGAAAMFRQQNAAPVSANDFAIYQNRMKAIQGVTGSTQDQVLESTQKIANMRQKYFSNASMTELQSVYLGLQGSGAYDTQEELDRAFDAFVKAHNKSGEGVYDFLYKFDWSKYADNGTNKTQIENTIRNMQWGALDRAAHNNSTDQQYTQAEETASKLRQLEETKNKLLIKVMEALAPVIEKLNVNTLSRFFESSMKLVLKITPLIELIVGKISDTLDTADSILDSVERGEYKEAAAKGFLAIPGMSGLVSLLVNRFAKGDDKNPNGQPKSNGGLATMPSICGERGPEMVIPLSYDRAARRDNLIANFTQNFSMSGNQTTALSLASAVKSRDFSRAMATNSYLNTRLGR